MIIFFIKFKLKIKVYQNNFAKFENLNKLGKNLLKKIMKTSNVKFLIFILNILKKFLVLFFKFLKKKKT